MNIKTKPDHIQYGRVFIIHLRVATHSGWLKTPLGAKGACNQKRKILSNLHTVGCTPHPRLLEECYPVGAITVELCSMAKDAPFGGWGSNPLQGLTYVYPSLISSASSFGHVGRSFPPPRSSFVIVVEEQELKII